MILPHDKHYLIESLKRAIIILQSLPDKKECKQCKFFERGNCAANDYKEIPSHIAPVGCNAWEWDGVPFV